MRIRLAAILLQTGVHSPQGREQIANVPIRCELAIVGELAVRRSDSRLKRRDPAAWSNQRSCPARKYIATSRGGYGRYSDEGRLKSCLEYCAGLDSRQILLVVTLV